MLNKVLDFVLGKECYSPKGIKVKVSYYFGSEHNFYFERPYETVDTEFNMEYFSYFVEQIKEHLKNDYQEVDNTQDTLHKDCHVDDNPYFFGGCLYALTGDGAIVALQYRISCHMDSDLKHISHIQDTIYKELKYQAINIK